jgi:hypothetical protein
VRAVLDWTVTRKLPLPPVSGGDREATVTSRCPPEKLACPEPSCRIADVTKLVSAIARAIAKEDHEQETGSSQFPNKDQSISGRGSKGGS